MSGQRNFKNPISLAVVLCVLQASPFLGGISLSLPYLGSQQQTLEVIQNHIMERGEPVPHSTQGGRVCSRTTFDGRIISIFATPSGDVVHQTMQDVNQVKSGITEGYSVTTQLRITPRDDESGGVVFEKPRFIFPHNQSNSTAVITIKKMGRQ